MIDPGQLNKRLAIQTPVESADGQGGVTRSFTTLATAWASITPAGNRADVSADALATVARYRIVMRSNFSLTLQHRLLEGGRSYRIVGISDRDDRRFLVIDAELQVG